MRKVLIIVLMLGLSISIMAQESFAASVETTFAGVEIKLNNTDEWLLLADGSNTPLSAGDAVRTNSSGRAILSFLENSSLLLLPETTYTLIEFSETDDELTLHAEIDGIGIQEVTDIANFELRGNRFWVVAADGLFGIWSDKDIDIPENDTIIVAHGHLMVDDGYWILPLDDAHGLYAGVYNEAENLFGWLIMLPPYNQARLIGTLEGCIGTVQTRDDTRGVLVRTGAGTGYQRRGLIEDSGSVRLMGETESTGWTQIQFLNGFGWVVSSAVTTDCDLPSLPDDSPEESIIQVTNADEIELAMLRPFYGNPVLDTWFYDFEAESD